jgi:hypothetical protein
MANNLASLRTRAGNYYCTLPTANCDQWPDPTHTPLNVSKAIRIKIILTVLFIKEKSVLNELEIAFHNFPVIPLNYLICPKTSADFVIS